MLAVEFKMMTASCQPEYIFIDTFGIIHFDFNMQVLEKKEFSCFLVILFLAMSPIDKSEWKS